MKALLFPPRLQVVDREAAPQNPENHDSFNQSKVLVFSEHPVGSIGENWNEQLVPVVLAQIDSVQVAFEQDLSPIFGLIEQAKEEPKENGGKVDGRG